MLKPHTALEVYTRKEKKKSSCTLKWCHVLGDVRGEVFLVCFVLRSIIKTEQTRQAVSLILISLRDEGTSFFPLPSVKWWKNTSMA